MNAWTMPPSHNINHIRLLFKSANSRYLTPLQNLPLTFAFSVCYITQPTISKQTVMACASEQWLRSVNSSLYRDVHISEAVAPLGRLELRSDGYFASDLICLNMTIILITSTTSTSANQLRKQGLNACNNTRHMFKFSLSTRDMI